MVWILDGAVLFYNELASRLQPPHNDVMEAGLMAQFLLYLLRLEILVVITWPIVYGLWSRRHGLNERRMILYLGALFATVMFTAYISFGQPSKLSDIPLIDWLVAGGISLLTFGFAYGFARLF